MLEVSLQQLTFEVEQRISKKLGYPVDQALAGQILEHVYEAAAEELVDIPLALLQRIVVQEIAEDILDKYELLKEKPCAVPHIGEIIDQQMMHQDEQTGLFRQHLAMVLAEVLVGPRYDDIENSLEWGDLAVLTVDELKGKYKSLYRALDELTYIIRDDRYYLSEAEANSVVAKMGHWNWE